MSGEWIDKRTYIAAMAKKKSDNPNRRNAYCFNAIKTEVEEACRSVAEYQESPELYLVKRQVADHLRSLRVKRVLLSFDLKQKSGRLVCVMWGLVKWEPHVRNRSPRIDLDELLGTLPEIRAVEEGKGVFEYGKVLPSYLPRILDDYDAALSTSEITFTVVCRICPPLAAVSHLEEYEFEYSWASFHAQDDVFEAKEAWEMFKKVLSEEERRVVEMKDQSKTIKEIAEALGSSDRTVNNMWNGIHQKMERYLNN
jgi:predicted transcriptional regulator